MAENKQLADQALHDIAEVWEVDKDRSEWSEEGFDWWPGDFRVSVRAQTDPQDRDPGTWRLLVKTDFLKDVPVRDEHFRLLASKASRFMTSTYACAYCPDRPGMSKSDAAHNSHNMWFVSCAYVNEQNVSWVATFLAQMSTMQPINAQLHAEFAAGMFKGGTPNTSCPEHAATAKLHPILGLAARVYVPIGKEKCRWRGTGEFLEFEETYARNDDCFGFGSDTGLTVETPFGSNSALIRLHTDQKHPALGNGLLATLQIPFFADASKVASECAWLNFFESVTWTKIPLFGCWYPDSLGPEEEQESLAFASFVPNALYRPGLATNIALWMIARARWLRRLNWPDLEDKTMMEIMQARVGFPSS